MHFVKIENQILHGSLFLLLKNLKLIIHFENVLLNFIDYSIDCTFKCQGFEKILLGYMQI